MFAQRGGLGSGIIIFMTTSDHRSVTMGAVSYVILWHDRSIVDTCLLCVLFVFFDCLRSRSQTVNKLTFDNAI